MIPCERGQLVTAMCDLPEYHSVILCGQKALHIVPTDEASVFPIN